MLLNQPLPLIEITITEPAEECPICHEEFAIEARKWTHWGGEEVAARIRIDRIARENTGVGIMLVGLASVAAGAAGIAQTPLIAIATTVLIGGVAAGILSMRRIYPLGSAL